MTTHRTVEVLDYVVPDRAGDIKKDTTRRVVVVGPSHGIRTAYSPSQAPIAGIPISWIASGTAEIDLLLGFIAARQGRRYPVWVPSGQQDFLPLSVFGSESLVFTKFGYTELMYPSYLGRKDIVVYPTGASPVYASILSSVDNGDETEKIGTSATLTPYAAGIATAKVSFLLLCRLASDEVEIRWVSSSVARCDFRLVEIPQNEIPALIDHEPEIPYLAV